MRILKRVKKEKWLVLIFLLTLSFRLFFVFQSPYFSDSFAYFHLSEIKSILTTGFPSERLYPPLFHYFGVVLYLIPLGLKIVPEILLSSIVIITYYMSKKITNDKNASLLTAVIVGFIPIYVTQTLNRISVYSLIIPLAFYMFYCLLNIEDNKYLKRFIIISFLLPLIHSSAILIGLAYLMYMLLLYIEDKGINKRKKEVILFFLFFTLLVDLIIYKNVLISLGLKIIYQNLPGPILLDFLKEIGLFGVITHLSFIPLIFGISGIVIGTIKEKNPVIFLLSGLVLSMFVLLLFKMIEFSVAIIFLGISFGIISCISFEGMYRYIRKTKIASKEGLVHILLIILVIITLIIPSFFIASEGIKKGINKDEVGALEWLKDNTNESSIILAYPEDGYVVRGISERETVMDNLYIKYPNADRRYNEIKEIYVSESEIKSLDLLRKFKVDYIYLSNRTKNIYDIDKISYIGDDRCFIDVFENMEVVIYEVIC